MGLRQEFRFKYSAPSEVQEFLRNFTRTVNVEDRGEFFVFTPREGPKFTFDCALMPSGVLSERAGEYYGFLGMFMEALTGHFGAVVVEDA
jgi:hypothetical protein